MLAYSDGIYRAMPYTTDGWVNGSNGGIWKDYYCPGLSRTYISFNERCSDQNWKAYVYTVHHGTPKTISLMMQTLTLPINIILYKGGYQSDNNQTNYNATEAVKNVTTEACKKLKMKYGEDLRKLSKTKK